MVIGTIGIVSIVCPGWHGNTLLVLGRAHELYVADAERGCQLVEAHDRRVAPALVKAANVLLAEPGKVRPPLLGQAFCCLIRSPGRHDEELYDRRAERVRKLLEQRDGRVFQPTFEAAYLGSIDTCVGGESLLRQVALDPKVASAPQVPAPSCREASTP